MLSKGSIFIVGLLQLLQGAVFASAGSKSFDVKKSLGNLSPYFTPEPTNGLVGGLGTGMPSECSLQQVQLMHRHGSRYPLSSELIYIANLSTLLNSPDTTRRLDRLSLPSEWKFIQGDNRWSNVMTHDNLTASGRLESFEHGVQFRLAYPSMPFEHILAGDQDRVVESAEWFRAGLFGRYLDDISTLSLIAEDNITISSITPMDSCPNWSYTEFGQAPVDEWGAVYLPPITKRINKILAPIQLTNNDVHGALYACAYELAAFGNTTWCDVFTETEIKSFEYELDLLMRGAFGYGLPNDMGPVLGSLFVTNLVNRLTNDTANKTYVEFGHDTTIDLALTALGLAKDKSYPITGPVNPSRKWRTSTQVPFSAMMVWEKWSCGKSTKIRLLLNGIPFSLAPICPIDKRTGTCELSAFVKGTETIRKVTWGDATWNTTCGNPGF